MGVLLAADLATFYFAYAAMTLAAYPLVVHFRTPEAFRAGRVYLGMAVLAEAAVLAAVLLIAAEGGNAALTEVPALVAEHAYRGVLVALIGVGFAVKAGVVPLHAWLALAHPAAPVPASALLSALLVKAALVAWWRLLPIGEVALPAAGGLLVAAGLASSLYASVVGVTQRRAKTVLAYSTVSQMGLMTAFTGTALLQPALAGVALTGVALFALHHGLAKGALFLGCGLHGRHRGAYLLLPALALVGVPATSGALAKAAGKQLSTEAVGAPAEPLLLLASALTAVLMVRFLLLAWRGDGARDPLAQRGAVLALVALSLSLPWLLAAGVAPDWVGYAWRPAVLLDALLPALAGGAVAAVLFGLAGAERLPRIPEGDWIKPALLAGVRLGRTSRRAWRRLPARPPAPSLAVVARLGAAVEGRLIALAMAGALFLLLVLGIALLGVLAGG
nr:proton-conducting transporter membrane subunit [Halorhodospira halophila]